MNGNVRGCVLSLVVNFLITRVVTSRDVARGRKTYLLDNIVNLFIEEEVIEVDQF